MTVNYDAGATIHDRYTLQEQIGRGGFSTVWQARDIEENRPVALKLASTETHDRDVVMSHFRRERDILAPLGRGLAHSTIVQLLDSNLEDEPAYLALEYLDGDALVDAFGTDTLGSGLRRTIIADLAETLDFIHRNSVVYLDLKAENVILRQSGRPVLIDFNAAIRTAERIDKRFEADQFKAPEVLPDVPVEGPIGPPADIFSWGKLAFYLLTGAKVTTEKVPEEGLDPRSFGSDCSPALARVVQRATKRQIHDRYEDGVSLAGAIAQATERGLRMVFTHQETELECAVGDGHTLGRRVAGKPVPWIELVDPEGHLSPTHARFERTGDGLALRDESLNGTYVKDEDGWTHVLSEQGYHAQREQGRFGDQDDRPPARLSLGEWAVIAPVHPNYGIRLELTAL